MIAVAAWHWDFYTFPQTFHSSYKRGSQIWISLNEKVGEEIGGGLAFVSGSHLWGNDDIDEGSKIHECFVVNVYAEKTKECQDLLEPSKVVPTVNAVDVAIFSRCTLHRSNPRKAECPFPSGRRLGCTLRMSSGSTVFKKRTNTCNSAHPIAQFEDQLKEGQRFESIIDEQGRPIDSAVYRPMTHQDSEEFILENQRGMGPARFFGNEIETLMMLG